MYFVKIAQNKWHKLDFLFSFSIKDPDNLPIMAKISEL